MGMQTGTKLLQKALRLTSFFFSAREGIQSLEQVSLVLYCLNTPPAMLKVDLFPYHLHCMKLFLMEQTQTTTANPCMYCRLVSKRIDSCIWGDLLHCNS